MGGEDELKECKCDKLQVFESLFNRYYAQVCKFFYEKVQNEWLAEDLAMEVFLKYWEKFDTFDEKRAAFATWLFAVAENKAKNYFRDSKKTLPLNTLSGQQDTTKQSFEEEIIQAEYVSFLRDKLADVLENLPERQMKIIILRFYHNKSSKKIAELIGISPIYARVLLFRGLEKIRTYFSENEIITK